MKRVKIFIVVPFDLYFCSEIEVQVNNFRKFGCSSQLQVLVYETGENKYKQYWDKLKERYNEVSFFFYRNDNLQNVLKTYPSYIRPYCLKEHWQKFPELEKEAFMYLDADVLFTKHFDIKPFLLKDNTCYCSKTSYIDADYFGSKRKDVLPFRLEEYDKIDILNQMAAIAGIDKQVIIDNIPNTGGCQWVLKNIDVTFWEDLAKSCLELNLYTKELNKKFFANEDKGFQSWAIGDMCGLLWILWKRGIKTSCPDTMDFSWSSSPIALYEKCTFFHNAGVPTMFMEYHGKKCKMFSKSDLRFRSNTLTFFDLEYEGISREYCSYKYVDAIREVKNPVCKTNKTLY